MSYIREDDDAEMAEIAPHQFVNREAAEQLHLVAVRLPAPLEPQR